MENTPLPVQEWPVTAFCLERPGRTILTELPAKVRQHQKSGGFDSSKNRVKDWNVQKSGIAIMRFE
jgi:hypothetical protein